MVRGCGTASTSAGTGSRHRRPAPEPASLIRNPTAEAPPMTRPDSTQQPGSRSATSAATEHPTTSTADLPRVFDIDTMLWFIDWVLPGLKQLADSRLTTASLLREAAGGLPPPDRRAWA